MVRFVVTVIALCAFELIMPLDAAAQQSSPGSAQLTLKQQLVQTEARRRNRIAGNMLLSSQEQRDFWPVYQKYRGAVVGVVVLSLPPRDHSRIATLPRADFTARDYSVTKIRYHDGLDVGRICHRVRTSWHSICELSVALDTKQGVGDASG